MVYDFKLVRMTKPTGDAECPPYVDRAHYVESLINEKVGTRDLDDDDIVVNDAIDLCSDDESSKPSKANKPTSIKVKVEPRDLGPIARRSGTPHTRSSRAGGLELLGSISQSLDPHLLAARDEERAARAMQNTQLLALSNQLRDAQITIDNLRNQLSQVERDRNLTERRADRLKIQLDMIRMSQGRGSGGMSLGRGSGGMPQGQGSGVLRRETRYADGGASTIFISPSDDVEFNDVFADEEQDVVSRRYFTEDPVTGRYTRPVRSCSTSPTLHPRQRYHSASMTTLATPSSSRHTASGVNVSLSPAVGDMSIVISPSHRRDAGPSHLPPNGNTT